MDDNECCPLCFAIARFLVARAEREFFACPRCDLVFVPARFHLSHEATKTRYLLHENSCDNAGYVARFENFIDPIIRFAPPPKSALDFGCGPSPVLVELLRRHGYEANGYDIYFTDYEPLHAQYDLVVSTETFEHLTAPRQSIDRMMHRLRLGGVLAVMTQFHGGPETIADWWYARDPTHVAFYSLKTFEFLAARSRLTLLFNNSRDTVIMQWERGESGA